jgi:hypothetical protein
LARSKERSEVEYLRAENKRLKKQLKQAQKQKHFYENIVDDAIDEVEVHPDSCEDCGKGTLIVMDFKYVQIKKCDNCGKQSKL